MSHFTIYPPDPDCVKCKGTGTCFDTEGYNRNRENPYYNMCNSFSECSCRSYANIEKIKQRCKHEFTCKKCGKVEEIINVQAS